MEMGWVHVRARLLFVVVGAVGVVGVVEIVEGSVVLLLVDNVLVVGDKTISNNLSGYPPELLVQKVSCPYFQQVVVECPSVT